MRKINFVLVVCIVLLFIVGSAYAAIVYPSATKNHYPNRGYLVAGRAKLRASAVLTASYVVTDFTPIRDFSNIGLYFNITQGGLTSIEYKVQTSHNGSDWYDEVTETVGAGVVVDTALYYTRTLGGDEKYYKPLPIRGQYMRLQVKGTGTMTGSLCEIYMYGRY